MIGLQLFSAGMKTTTVLPIAGACGALSLALAELYFLNLIQATRFFEGAKRTNDLNSDQ